MTEKFNRYQQAHSRLHDPEVLQSSASFIPVALEEVVRPKPIVKKQSRRLTFAPAGVQRLLALDQWPSLVRNTDLQLSDPLRYKSLTDYVLWLRTVAASPVRPVTNGSPENVAGAKDPPNIRLTSLTLAGEIELFQEQRFGINAPGAREVELVWRESNGGATHRVLMDHESGDHFKTSIGIDDGDYFVGYRIDGWMRPDRLRATTIALRPDGAWNRFRLSRHERLLAIHNRRIVDELLRIESTCPWLVPSETRLKIPALASVPIVMRVLPRKMTLGVNKGSVHVHAFRNTKELNVASLPIEMSAKAIGAVAEFKYQPEEFGWIMQGHDQLRLEVEVVARGSGGLAGMVMLRHSGELADFRLDAASDEPQFRHTFVVDSSNLPHFGDGKLKMTFVTDSYLSNYRLFETELPYRLIFLKKSLPALSYGSVNKGATRTLRVDVERSDGKAVNLEVLIPDQARLYLDAYRAGPAAFSFRFDSRKLPSGEVVKEVVTLLDRSSGLSDHLRILAEVSN